MIHWKSLALVLSGILLGCAANVARTAHADSDGDVRPNFGEVKCVGPSGDADGVQEDINLLMKQGFHKLFSVNTANGGGIVCGMR